MPGHASDTVANAGEHAGGCAGHEHQPAGANPEPMHNVPVYNYAAVIAYNLARTPGAGSAIFLHVGDGHATAGCVSLPQAQLRKIIRWLTPTSDPVIAMGVL
jgi:L,D-peptidoglycan transpeptidase YkuD (ErfK/YbiS/YcfS/YnhG family)